MLLVLKEGQLLRIVRARSYISCRLSSQVTSNSADCQTQWALLTGMKDVNDFWCPQFDAVLKAPWVRHPLTRFISFCDMKTNLTRF